MKIDKEINKDNIEKTIECLIENGIDKEEAENVLQAIGYTLLDTELLPNRNMCTISLDCFEVGIDCRGRCIMRSKFPFDKKTIEKNGYTPFKSISFITIDKEDAQNLYEMLEEAIDKLVPDEKKNTYKDITAFGDKAISFERLYDYLNGETYHIDKMD